MFYHFSKFAQLPAMFIGGCLECMTVFEHLANSHHLVRNVCPLPSSRIAPCGCKELRYRLSQCRVRFAPGLQTILPELLSSILVSVNDFGGGVLVW